ncbi:unnamed protein product [Polarella glacialis]|uniref:C3H1-type domain-containing protein n=1 Tax=Polarella glacialis TaxID=89957 RepID=A0A813FN48_POLGL|nr:unnamed protein product [Polarella glacialis]
MASFESAASDSRGQKQRQKPGCDSDSRWRNERPFPSPGGEAELLGETELLADEGTEDGVPRRRGHKAAQHRSTRREMRAAAPDGLLVEDVLRRLEFDEVLVQLQESEVPFSALVLSEIGDARRRDQNEDPDADADADHRFSQAGRNSAAAIGPVGASLGWCRPHVWTGQCKYGQQCRHSHSGRRLALWQVPGDPGPPLLPPIGRRSPHLPMIEVSLEELRAGANPLQSLCFLLFKQLVVWGPELGHFGTELWSSFLRDKHGLPPTSAHQQGNRGRGNCSDWAALPSSLWERVVSALPAGNLPALVLALPLGAVAWEGVLESRWGSSLAAEQASSGSREGALHAAAELVALVSASRLAAPLLRWPLLAHPVMAAPPAPWGYPLPLDTTATATLRAREADSEGNVRELPRALSRGLQEVAAALPEPRKLRIADIPAGLCMDASLLVLLTGEEVTAVRRHDLRRVSCVKVKDSSCVDFRGELLLVGTEAPARLLAFDLTEAAPRRPQCQLKLGNKASASAVLKLAFVGGPSEAGAEFCVCGLSAVSYISFLAGESSSWSGLLTELLLVDCRGGSLTAVRRLDAPGSARMTSAVVLGSRCIAANVEGEFSLWDLPGDGDEPCQGQADAFDGSAAASTRGQSSSRLAACGLRASWLAGDLQGKWVAAAPGTVGSPAEVLEMLAATQIEVLDMSNSVWRSLRFPVASPDATSSGEATDFGIQNSEEGAPPPGHRRVGGQSVTPKRWVAQLHIEGPVLLAVEVSLELDSRLFAWHLPSGRPLALGHQLPGHVSLAVSHSGAGPVVFAGALKSGERFVLVPGVRNPASKAECDGGSPPVPVTRQPAKRTTRPSDARARGTVRR